MTGSDPSQDQLGDQRFDSTRIAFLSVVQGSGLELDAVLADLQLQEPVDEVWAFGDLAAAGYGPDVGWERLSLPANTHFVRGSTDSDLTSGRLAAATRVDGQASPKLLPGCSEKVRSVAWVRSVVTGAGWLDWQADLPIELAAVMPYGRRLRYD